MKITYRPEGKPEEHYDFEPAKLLSPEAEAIEDLKGAPWDSFEEFGALFLKGNARAHRAALWIMKRRQEPGLEFADLTYPLGAFQVTFSDDEAEKFRQSIQANPDLDNEQKAYMLRILGIDQHAGEFKDGSDLKDLSPNSGDTASTSALPDSPPA